MSTDNADAHQQCTEKFIALANTMKDDGMSKELVSAALMSASCVYATYSVAGNEGGLNSSGVKKVVATYASNLKGIQSLKRKEAGLE